MFDIAVDEQVCTGCGACVALCTGRVFSEFSGRAEVVAPQGCWLCGHCVAACPADAIRHSEYPVEACPKLDTQTLPSLDGLVATFRERRSARVFLERPVPREAVRQLVDISRWAPSAGNRRPVDWLAFDDPARIAALSSQATALLLETARLLRSSGQTNWTRERAERFEGLAQRRGEGEDPIVFRAPVVLVAHVPADDYFGRDDAVYAAHTLMLAAQRAGLGTCHIGFFPVALDQSQDLCRAVGLPEDRRAQATLVLGYPQYGFARAIPRRRPELTWHGSQ